MAINIEFSTYALQDNETLIQRVQFVYSPLNELFRSLHVLLNPRHHGMNIDWALEIQKKMSHNFFNDLHYFSALYELGVPPFLFDNFERISANLDQEIEQLQQYLLQANSSDIIRVLEKTLNERNNQFIPTLAKNLEWQGFSLNASDELLYDLKKDPHGVFQHLLNFIKKYREQVFDKIWQEKNLEMFLKNEIKKQSIYLSRYGFNSLIDNLQIGRIFWQKEQLVVVKPFERSIQLTDRDAILFIPSYFIWPHLFVNQFKHGIVLCYDALNKLNTHNHPQQLADVFNALSDVIRLKIMKHLANTPSTTQALGQILTMSDSTVSHHLKILKKSGLVTTHKQGKFVLYMPTSTISDLIPGFYNYLDNNSFPY